MEWQPIETAPIGTAVLVWFSRFGMSYNVMYLSKGGEWIELCDDGRRLNDGYEPSHWMQLPEPPTVDNHD